MPRSSVAALKPASSRLLSRRNQSDPHCCHNGSCKAGTHHATLALSSLCIPCSSSCSSSASQSHCAGLPVSSLSSCSASVEPSSSAISMAQPSSDSASISVLPAPDAPPPPQPSALEPKAPSASSSTCSTSSPNSSVSCSQQTLQDTLYEYVKGLQDAIKVPDPELAERLLLEIGNALSLPSAVSLVISANGARLIASCVKHFRWHGMQKPLKVASKIGRSGPKVSSSKGEEHDPGGEVEIPASVVAEAEDECSEPSGLGSTSMDVLLPFPTVSNESRRKRQRTVGDLEEDEDVLPSYGNEIRPSFSDKCRKPVKLKGRSLKGSSSRKTGTSEPDTGKCSVEDKSSEITGIVGNGKCWAKECRLKPESIGELGVKDLEIEEKLLADNGKAEEIDEGGLTGEDDGDSVYCLAKSSGMSNVVATACSALDKLLTAALQSKVGIKSKAGNTGTGKRGKALSAEMYVALTEAFVDMVHVLKDNVDLLSWCLNCLGSILPPGSLERASFESTTFNSVAPVKETAVSEEDSSKTDSSDTKQQVPFPTPSEQQILDQKLFPSKALLKLATKYRDHSSSSDFTLKIGSKSSSGSYVAAARSLSSAKSSKGMLQSTFCSGIGSESTSSSISALAAVAYAATVPMLAEKAVKAILSAMQSCDIEGHSTMAALRALSAHLSSTNSKSACDDAFTFIIAAMREFVDDVDMQAESCLALGSLIRAVSSTTGHAAWAAITVSMDRHRNNLAVQRAGCSALQVLCTRTGLGVPEWRTGKRPLRASRDSDREAGARALISSMSSFPNDVRIQWHGCSTLWTLVHSAGVKSVGNMVKYGAVSAVVGAMSVCRMNEMMQQEGCNVIGTMVRTLAENGQEIGLFLSPSSENLHSKAKSEEEHASDEKVGDEVLEKDLSSTDWWAALGAVVSAMKMFNKSKSLQSNGTFALGCILKGSGEAANLGVDVPPLGKLGSGANTKQDIDCGKGDSTKLQAKMAALPSGFPGKDIVDNVERISAAVEATMAAMKEFSKVETVQVWGCAVLQHAFLAYVHYAKCLGPVSEAYSTDLDLQSPLFSQHQNRSSAKNGLCSSEDSNATTTAKTEVPDSPVPSPSDSLAKLILSQATSAMYMISRTMALSYNNTSGSQVQAKLNAAHAARGKPTLCSRSQTTSSTLFFSSVRQSWCAALGAIGDVFGYLTRSSEVAIGKGGFTNSDCMDFFRSNRTLFDRSPGDQCLHMDTRSFCDDERSETEDGTLSEKSSLDIGKQDYQEENERKRAHTGHRCATSSWIDWSGFGTSQHQAVKDIKAWQEATESMAKIAEEVGFPLSVKNAILSIRTIFYKLEDAETVIWACHALVSLYLTWENLHLFKPGTDVDKAKIWGDGEAGVRQLVDLVVHWTNQNRLDVTSLALQALYGACVFAATVQEIEKVFALGGCGPDAVLGAMQKALLSGSAQHRRKVVQSACCVLATVCGYSIRAQVEIAAHGGADLILTALDRYNEDNQIQVNGLHALGIDSHAQPDFDAIWNSAIAKTAPTSKSSRRKRGNQTSAVVGLTHIFREGVNCPAFRDALSAEEACSYLKGKWNPCFERLVLHGAAQFGLFRTAVLAAPGCGGPPFAMELLTRLAESGTQSAEMQAHVCFVIGYMAEHNSTWRASFVEAGIMETILSCMATIYSWKQTVFTVFGMLHDGAEIEIQAETDDMGNTDGLSDAFANSVDSRIQCAAAWAIAGLAKDQSNFLNRTTKSIVQALVVALHRYGGLLSIPPYGLRSKKSEMEVCAPARLALARLGVYRVAINSQAVYLVHEAAETGDVLCLKALAEKGADLFVTDHDGKNGEWHAELFGQTQATQFLKEQIQVQGRKKAREKAKTKNKQNNRKKSSEPDIPSKEEDVSSQVPAGDGLMPSVETESSTVQPDFRSDIAADSTTDSTNMAVVGEVSDTHDDEEKAKGSQKASRSTKKKSHKTAKGHDPETPEPGLSGEQQELVERLNTGLRESMASGEVEKMESAIRACDEACQPVDERLLKQVKGALAKRLKRREKASVLEDELAAAIEEGGYSRLHAAVIAVEQSPRFATALQEKLAAAKSLLLTLGGPTGDDAQVASENGKPQFIEEEIIMGSEPRVAPPQKSKNRRRKDKASGGQEVKDNAPGHELKEKVSGQELPPLLPTPRASLRPSSQTRSVIMPPKSAAQPSTSCEHNPITPQLFPSNRSPLLCNTDFGEYNDSAQLSLLLSSSWSSPRSCTSIEEETYRSRWGGANWSQSRSSTPVEEHLNYGMIMEPPQWGGAWSDTPAVDSEGYIAALLSTLFPVERLPSSSTTLFSASLGEFPTPAAAECATTKLSSPSGLLPAGPGMSDDSDILSFLDSTLSNNNDRNEIDEAAGDEESNGWNGSQAPNMNNISNGRRRLPSYLQQGHQHSSLFLEENPCRRMSSIVTTASSSSSPLQSRLQACALLEAEALEDCCCICFDMPKDAALVPCGHRMCKSCAQQMRRVRHNCPICNRYIDAVLALYG